MTHLGREAERVLPSIAARPPSYIINTSGSGQGALGALLVAHTLLFFFVLVASVKSLVALQGLSDALTPLALLLGTAFTIYSHEAVSGTVRRAFCRLAGSSRAELRPPLVRLGG